MGSPPRAVRKEINPPSAEQINQLLEEAKTTQYYEVLHTASFTGMRRGELLAVRWRDVNLDLATLSVNRSVYRAKGAQSIYQNPKTAKGRRLVDLPLTLYWYLGSCENARKRTDYSKDTR